MQTEFIKSNLFSRQNLNIHLAHSTNNGILDYNFKISNQTNSIYTQINQWFEIYFNLFYININTIINNYFIRYKYMHNLNNSLKYILFNN